MGVISGNGQAVGGLGGLAGFGETALSRGDDIYFQLDLSAVFGATMSVGGAGFASNNVYLSTDGYLTFGQPPMGSLPADPLAMGMPFIAPFMADIDTRLDGEGAESGPIWLDIDPLQDVVTITWQDVGFYRRNASLTNTFQLQLFDRGNGRFDTVFRYDHINWVSGDLQQGYGGLGGTAAFVGFQNAAMTQTLTASGNESALLNLDNTVGNTGQVGMWVFTSPGLLPINGTAASDTLAGTIGDDSINGLGGNDVISGSAGADTIDGGAGIDSLYGGVGNDWLDGGADSDVLNGGEGFDIVAYDTAANGIRVDLSGLTANTGAALGDSFSQIESIVSGMFNDVLVGDAADNWLYSGDGIDIISGDSGNDYLSGGAGDDLLDGGLGADHLIGGLGFDTVRYRTALSAVRVNLSNPNASGGAAAGDVLSEIESLQGSYYNDSLVGDAYSNTLRGDLGNDFIYGGGGDDYLVGGGGDDVLQGGQGADFLNGLSGIDTANYQSATTAVRIVLSDSSLNTGEALGDVLLNIETLIGSQFNDSLTGDALANSLWGWTGNDVLSGMSGNDTLRGGAGVDVLYGGDGADSFIFTTEIGLLPDSIEDYAASAGDVVMVLGATLLSDISFVSAYLPNRGSAAVSDATLTHLPTNQTICTLTDVGSGSAFSLYVNGTTYFLNF